jgi:hypothetical protein
MDAPWLASAIPCAWLPTETNFARGLNTGKQPWEEPGWRNRDPSVFNLEAAKQRVLRGGAYVSTGRTFTIRNPCRSSQRTGNDLRVKATEHEKQQ